MTPEQIEQRRKAAAVFAAQHRRKPFPGDDGIWRVPLTQGKIALVSAEDAERVGEYSWAAHRHSTNGTFRAIRNGPPWHKQECISMARFILNAQQGEVVDHLNHDTLDNRRENIRCCTIAQNHANRRKQAGTTSQYKGVERRRNRWQARIVVQRHRIDLGIYDDEQEAARSYDQAAVRYFGPFALTNALLGLL
jgi:hypothetical protein